ncbi:DUF4407 domain-containing protein [Glutamicibacter ardleyensis]|uniref:DUF4407 domain-containing protein n=1 Tax=Glutamicibacter ardleyensis TaxID=225894 RepID=UPI003FD277A9
MKALSDWLVWLGGARQDIIKFAPGERSRFAAMGLVMLSTSLLAAVSAGFALVMALGLPVVLAAAAGVLWGFVILNLDRLLVVGMPKQKSLGANFWVAVPRVVLGLIIGIVISTPLTLQIFDSEIKAEIQFMIQEKQQAAEEKLAADPRFAEIPKLQKNIESNQQIISAGKSVDLNSDPNYEAAKAETVRAQKSFDQASRILREELDGTGGTGVPGWGSISRQKAADRDIAEKALDEAKKNEAEALAGAQTNLESGAIQKVSDAHTQLEKDEAQLQRLEALRVTSGDKLAAEIENSNGLLARLEALQRIGEQNGMMNLAHIMVAALFICIELLPIIFKTMTNAMSPTSYDEISAITDRSLVAASESWATKRHEAIEAEAGVQVSVAKHRANLQISSGKSVNEKVIEQQEYVVNRALEVWGEHAAKRAEEKMAEWENELDELRSANLFADQTPTSSDAQQTSYSEKSGLPEPNSI